ncbi:MAG: ppk [Verrucomicrobia bacterium]|jgi:polyphosphate kinase|nr:ppk [Verrucomicrobiota bacterium]
MSGKYGPPHFINRELSWLEFNQRVLDEALNPANPLLERVKFFCITSSNLDEFFEVRVAGLKQQIESSVVERSIDGRTATETFREVTKRVRKMVQQQYACWRDQLLPALATEAKIRFLDIKKMDKVDIEWIEDYYHTKVRPVLTPLGLDPAHPFPQLLNKSLNIMVQLEETKNGDRRTRMAIVQVPRILPRLVRLPRKDARQDYLFLGKLICHYLRDLFPGNHILGYWLFRVTRNSELYIDEEDSASLLKAVENELHNRRKGSAVRLEVEKDCPLEIRRFLTDVVSLEEEDVYVIDGPLNPTRLMTIYEGDHSPELRDVPFVATISPLVKDHDDVFEAIRTRDILLHHPYESFDTTVDFLQQAAQDPKVLAIKMTLYRTGGDRRVVGPLMDAVRNGKQVTAVVELKARFDEANNIEWSRRLEEAGVHVVYGLVGYKIHCKTCLVVRADDDGIRRYVHLSTGNYNASTSRFYTDIGLLTCHPDFGEDATNLFNLLTGVCQFPGMRKFLTAPFELHDTILKLIQREAENARKGLPARIIAKMNSLVDSEVIEAMYDASQAGVQIDLIVRGICCLRPQMKGISENIRVRSIVDRFLEHSRIFYFENACQPEVFVGSADWMPRNFFSRIEVVFPIDDGRLRARIMDEMLALALADNVKARQLHTDGTYRIAPLLKGEAAHRSQVEFIELSKGMLSKSRKPAKTTSKYPQVRVKPSPHNK